MHHFVIGRVISRSAKLVRSPGATKPVTRLLCHSAPVSQGYSQASLSFCPSVPEIQSSYFVMLSHCPTDTTKTHCNSVPVIQSGFCVILSRCPRDTVKLLCHAVSLSQGYNQFLCHSFPVSQGYNHVLCHSVPVSQGCILASLSFCSVVPKIQYNQATLSCCPSVQRITPGFFVILSQPLAGKARTFCHCVTVSPGYSQAGLSYSPSLPGIQPGLFVILPHSSRDTAYSLCHSLQVSRG
jgi:hypothetical protein